MSDTTSNTPMQAAKIIMVAVADLYIPDWNPRHFMDEEPLQDLMDYIAKGRFIERILIWKGTGVAASSSISQVSAQGPYAVISGQRRLEARKRLGQTLIEAEELDISVEEARFLAIESNKDEKPYWLGEFIATAALVGSPNYPLQKDVAERLHWTETRVSDAVILTQLLNSTARELLNQASTLPVTNTYSQNALAKPISKTPKVVRVPESAAIELTPLWDEKNKATSQELAVKAVRLIKKHQLTAAQTAELVAGALSGQDLAEFEPSAKPRMGRPIKGAKAKAPTPTAQTLTSVHTKASPQTSAGVTDSGHGKTISASLPESALSNRDPHRESSGQTLGTGDASSSIGTGTTKAPTDSHINMESVQPNHGARHEASPQASAGSLGVGETVLYDTLAGVSIIAKIKTKLKKGEKPTASETLLLAGHALWTAIHWLGKHGFKLVKWFFKETWRLSKNSFKVLSKTWVGTIFKYACVIFFIWLFGTAYFFGFSYPLHVMGHFISQHLKWQNTASVQGQALSVPTLAKEEIGTPAPTSQITKHKKIKLAAVIPTSTPVVSTPTLQKGPDLLGEAAKQAAPDLAADAAKKLFGL